MITFASDNYASACPEVIQAIIDANEGHANAYGADEYTAKATQLIQSALGGKYPLWFVGTGTAANTLALKSVLKSYQSVICAETAHIITHETGAPHHLVGAKFLTLKSLDGKITPDQIRQNYQQETAWGIHATQPSLVSISQTTETGSVYSLDELNALRRCCDDLNLLLHIDGCRIYNAAAALECELSDIAQFADVLSLGGTKAGLMFGEAVVFVNQDLATGFEYLQKQGLQLFSKMRYVSAQFIALYEHNIGLRMAVQCNRLAKKLADSLSELEGFKLVSPAASNMIFIEMPASLVEPLQAHTPFYCMPGTNQARLVISHDVTESDIDLFIAYARLLIAEQCK